MQHNWLRLKYDIPVSEKICTPHARCMAKTVFLVYCYLTLVWYAILFLVHLNCYSIVLFFYFYFTYGYLQLPFSFSKPLFILHFRKPALQISNSTVWLSEFMLKSTTTFYFFFLTVKTWWMMQKHFSTEAEYALLCFQLKLKATLVIMNPVKKKWLGLWRHTNTNKEYA